MIYIFGLIYTVVASIGVFFHSINENKENEKNKIRYKHPNKLTYIDTKGRSRLLSNDELVFYVYDKNGDYILENAAGYVYRNFSKEERIRKLNELKDSALKNKESTYCIDDNNHKKDWICKGKRFKDFKTGDVYVVRWINYKYYYMNISNGLLVRKTDWQIKQDKLKINDETYGLNKDVDIREFNKKQINIQNKSLLYRNFEYNSSCDRYK